MRSARLPGLLFAILLPLTVAYILYTSQSLPEPTATHFGASGRADGSMTRNGYQLFMLLFSVGLPLLIVLAMSLLPRRFPHLTNLPSRAYWLAPERRAQAQSILDASGLWFACALEIFLAGLHWLLLQANARQPARLDNAAFLAMLGGFLCLTALWAVLFLRSFRPPRG